MIDLNKLRIMQQIQCELVKQGVFSTIGSGEGFAVITIEQNDGITTLYDDKVTEQELLDLWSEIKKDV